MATEQIVEKFRDIAVNLVNANFENIIRLNLDEESIPKTFGKKIEELKNKVGTADKYSAGVFSNVVKGAYGHIEAILILLAEQNSRNTTDYISHMEGFVNSFNDQYEQFLNLYPHFVAAGIDSQNLLEKTDISEQTKEAMEDINLLVSGTGQKLRELSEAHDKKISSLIDERLSDVQKTAAKISAKDAQDEFELAEFYHRKWGWIWAIVSIVSLVAIVLYGYYYLKPDSIIEKINTIKDNSHVKWVLIYLSISRFVILGALVTFSAFSIRFCKAHMHLREKYHHNKRLANSLGSLTEAAGSERVLILTPIVNAMASFGNSGILSGKDDSTNLPIENIAKTIKPND